MKLNATAIVGVDLATKRNASATASLVLQVLMVKNTH
jgi:hypothetical protein